MKTFATALLLLVAIRAVVSWSSPGRETVPVRPLLEETPVGGLLAWWPLDGSGREAVTGGLVGSVVGDVRRASGHGMRFGGNGSAILLPDSGDLAFTDSFSLSVWLRADRLPSWQGQIFFRGDNRGGLDPYFLAIEGNGMVRFAIEPNVPDKIAYVDAPIPIRQWVHVVAVYSAAASTLRIYINGREAAEAAAAYRPFGRLDPSCRPGIAIGNTQDPGAYNQPFVGTLRDLQVYSRALTPDDVTALHKRPA